LIRVVAQFRDPFDQRERAGDTSDWLSWDCHRVIYARRSFFGI
jgi:hypothetical protein